MLMRRSTNSGLAFFFLLWTLAAPAQQPPSPDEVPENFRADATFAAHVRALIAPATLPATGRYAVAQQVLDRLTADLPASAAGFSWNIRIAPHAGNVFSSPDGTIFVDEDLADALKEQPGLWAAALSHEVAHISRRDWARRFLYQQALEQAGANQIALGDNNSGGTWIDPIAATRLLDSFCQTQELEADVEGLLIMARAGFHPAFMPALYHILQGDPFQPGLASADATHPLWERRDAFLRAHFADAHREFDRRWPTPSNSPGGNPPMVVYAGAVSTHRSGSGDIQLEVPLRCDNVYGGLDVVLHISGSSYVPGANDLHQDTGCTSDPTLITFTLPPSLARSAHRTHDRIHASLSILDDRGVLLTTAPISSLR
jgi:Zn-dependent protease with chaperone function